MWIRGFAVGGSRMLGGEANQCIVSLGKARLNIRWCVYACVARPYTSCEVWRLQRVPGASAASWGGSGCQRAGAEAGRCQTLRTVAAKRASRRRMGRGGQATTIQLSSLVPSRSVDVPHWPRPG